MVSLTLTATAPAAAPTQALRDIIDRMGAGVADERDAHNALLQLEMLLGLPMTTPTIEEEV